MNYFVSYEMVGNNLTLISVGQCVITNSTPSSIMADLQAIKNDNGNPDAHLRVLCLTVLPSE